MEIIKPLQMLSLKDFFEYISSQRGAPFCTFHATTEPDMKKTGNPYWGTILKVSYVNGALGRTYENAVQNQREREGNEEEFIPEPRKWGMRLNRFFVVHVPKGEKEPVLYLTVTPNAVLEPPRYVVKGTNLEIDVEKIRPFLNKSWQPKTQGTEKEVIHREYNTISFDEIVLGQTIITLRHDTSWKDIVVRQFPMALDKYPDAYWESTVASE